LFYTSKRGQKGHFSYLTGNKITSFAPAFEDGQGNIPTPQSQNPHPAPASAGAIKEGKAP
jgi:hypothetical protein